MRSRGESSSQDASVVGQLVRGHGATIMDQKLRFPQALLIDFYGNAEVSGEFYLLFLVRNTGKSHLFMYRKF